MKGSGADSAALARGKGWKQSDFGMSLWRLSAFWFSGELEVLQSTIPCLDFLLEKLAKG